MEISNEERIQKIIDEENKYNPFTDEDIANSMEVLRETVTNLRKKLGIPNSRERKKEVIVKEILNLISREKNPSNSDILEELKVMGAKISQSILDEIFDNLSFYKEKYSIENSSGNSENSFSKLIGHERSLTKIIKQAQASLLYPPFGLSTLIIGESGIGKTLFADCMYDFALENNIIKSGSPYITLNCADYADNPQLLLSILYGYKKGSFTGAEDDTPGFVEKANNGILFLDEIHRLPPKGQEILFTLLDKGKFRRLGETYNERSAKVLFLCATTENIESSLLISFRRRIPMIISIPPLEDRSLEEKIELACNFFQEECNRTNLKLFVDSKVLEAFVLKKYQGNIGQMKSEIKVTCANAYVDNIGRKSKEIHIGLNDILYNNIFSEGLNFESSSMIKIKTLINDKVFMPYMSENSVITKKIITENYEISKDIYQQIEEKYYEIKKLNVGQEETKNILWTYVLNTFNRIESDAVSNKEVDSDDIDNLVDRKLIKLVSEFVSCLQDKNSRIEINKNILNHLSIHLNEAIKRINFKQVIINPNLKKIINEYNEEYKIAKLLVDRIEKEYQIVIPDDEVGFIAMYMKALKKTEITDERIGIIILSHGKVASEMVSVVNKLMNVDFPIAIDMPLNESPTKIFERTIEIAKIIDNGNGILFFSDMGSLLNIGDVVSKRTGIKTRTIDRVDIVTLIEAVRKVYISEGALDHIYFNIVNSRYALCQTYSTNQSKPSVIVTLCLTGKGLAVKIKQSLLDAYNGIEIITIGMMNEKLAEKMKLIKQKYNIIAAIGTMNPNIEGINYIQYSEDLIKSKYLELLINKDSIDVRKNVLNKDLIIVDKIFKSKAELLDYTYSLLYNGCYVKKEYINSLIQREDMNTTYVKGGIAIPHGMPAYVNKTTLLIVKLKEKINWDKECRKVDMIFMPVVKENDIKLINTLLKIVKSVDIVSSIKKSKSNEEIYKLISEIINK
ncbi:PRD domain-containing protein [Alkalibaculum sp. M08DMB]|uniref:PRD domain-containing protein n=1 Tax=Alkalibaculum sporogenes TaxID=2655001 RepID=A0A6A7K7M3_9FIRM|nr:sigma 54-interacting transcriptional regulator [Alkalibaculum sporogenes]MPW25488.1 PRD domain-containing protein [Alkalibaculum sporogenes]